MDKTHFGRELGVNEIELVHRSKLHAKEGQTMSVDFKDDRVVRPLLGSAADLGAKEIELATEFDQLHQLIYARGGIRPTNAAIEEVAKLIALKLWISIGGSEDARGLFSYGRQLSATGDFIVTVKRAFSSMLGDPRMGTADISGHVRSLWPEDEPFRLTNPEVVQRALALTNKIVETEVRVSDPLGAAFDSFLSGRYDHSGGLGTYLTPSSIARMMSEIAFDLLGFDGSSSPQVIDPFCGTGRFLVAAYEELARRGASTSTLHQFASADLAGADQSPQSVAKAGLNLLLLGASGPRVFSVADSITSPELDVKKGEFDLVLTNPPFGGNKYSDSLGIEKTREVFSLPNNGSIDPALAGTALALNMIRPGGVVGIVLPDGIINSRPFIEMTKNGGYQACAVVSLPTVTFSLSGTVAKTSAVFLRKSDGPVARTAISRVEHVGFKKQSGKPVADPDGSEVELVPSLISQALNPSRSSSDVYVVSESPLVCSLDPTSIDSLDPARLDPDAARDRSTLLKQGGIKAGTIVSKQNTRRASRFDGEPFVSVLHVDALGNVDWRAANNYYPATAGQVAVGGQLLISLLNPSKFRATVVPYEVERVQCSLEFGVFDAKVNPYGLLAILNRDDVRSQLRPLGTGTSSSRRRIRDSDIEDLVIPDLDKQQIDRLGGIVSEAAAAIHSSRSTLESVYRLEL